MLYPDSSYITNPKIHILYQKEKKSLTLTDYYVQSFEGRGGEIRDFHFIAGLDFEKRRICCHDKY